MKKALLIVQILIIAITFYLCSSNTNSNSKIDPAKSTNSINYPELLPNSTVSFKSEFNGDVFVIDDSKYRYLKFGTPDNDGIQSQVSLTDKTKLLFHYTKTSMIGLALFESPESEINNVLMIGLGGGSMPRFLKKVFPNIKIDSVDIDPVVVGVAKHYFFVEENDDHKIFVQDGRKFVENSKKKYDVVFLDAFNAEDSIPHQLTSIEFLEALKKCMSKNGVLITNFINHNQKVYGSIFKTFKSSFKYVIRFHLLKFKSGNIIIIAFDDDSKNLTSAEIKKKIEKLTKIFDSNYDLKKYVDTLNSDKLSYDTSPIIHDN